MIKPQCWVFSHILVLISSPFLVEFTLKVWHGHWHWVGPNVVWNGVKLNSVGVKVTLIFTVWLWEGVESAVRRSGNIGAAGWVCEGHCTVCSSWQSCCTLVRVQVLISYDRYGQIDTVSSTWARMNLLPLNKCHVFIYLWFIYLFMVLCPRFIYLFIFKYMSK